MEKRRSGPPKTLNHLFVDAVDRYHTKLAAQRYKLDNTWIDIRHHELDRWVKLASLGLRELGLGVGDQVAILSETRYEWAIADFACLAAGCIVVPIYPSLPASQIRYILKDADVSAIFVSDPRQYQKIQSLRADFPNVKSVIVFENQALEKSDLPLTGLIQQGASTEDNYPSYEDDRLKAEPDDIATIIYTSGTTGDPKGVMLSHANFCSNVHAVSQVLDFGVTDSCLSFLPLSHCLERMAGHYYMFHQGVTINYAQSFDTVAADMAETRPTVVLAVPRVFEKIYARVIESAAAGTFKQRLFLWARKQEEEWSALTLAGNPVRASLKIKRALADRLVFAKLRKQIGGRLRVFISGAAPLSPEIAEFFFAAGLPVLEGYGLTETSPVISVNSLENLQIGSVGRPLPGVDVRIATDGEIICRGPNVTSGYFNRPEATREAIDEDGWFHTGDVGRLDEQGFLTITDRKKDIIATAGGKKIAPQSIENKAKLSEFVSNAVLIGDKRKFPIMLVVPDTVALAAWIAQQPSVDTDGSDMLTHPAVVSKVEREVMAQLTNLASYETPKKVLIVRKDFSIEGGELTPTMKVKRSAVETLYSDLIDSAYT